jgi:hypothetical protein
MTQGWREKKSFIGMASLLGAGRDNNNKSWGGMISHDFHGEVEGLYFSQR